MDLAEQRGWTPVSPGEKSPLEAITSSSLYPALIVCDLADIPSSRRVDVEPSLGAIAEGMLENHAFLMVPDNSVVVQSDAWRGATANATYLEEPMVTRKNLGWVLPLLTATSDLGDLSELAKKKGFIQTLKKFRRRARPDHQRGYAKDRSCCACGNGKRLFAGHFAEPCSYETESVCAVESISEHKR